MKATCPSCNAHLNIDDKKIPAGGARIKCPTCQNIFPVKPGAASGAVPLPGAASAPAPAGPGAVPLPGATTAHAPPSNIAGGAVPLPGNTQSTPSDTEWEDAPTRMQPAFIPPEAVPGATTAKAPPSNVHDQAATRKAPAYKPPAVGSSAAVPLPGVTSQAPAPTWAEESTRVSAAPVPSEAFAPGAPAHVDFGAFEPTANHAVPLPGATGAPQVSPATQRPPAMRSGAVPLPGSAAGSYDPTQQHGPGSFEPTVPGRGGAAVPLPGGAAHPPAPSHAGAVPLPGNSDFGAIDFSESTNDFPSGAATHVGPPAGRGVPLPGAVGHSAQPASPRSGRGVPLPGATGNGAVPLPGGHEAQGAAPSFGDSVPLPGGYEPTGEQPSFGDSVPLPGGYEPTGQQPSFGDNVPLPGEVTAQTDAYPPQAFTFDPVPTGDPAPSFNDVPEASGADFAEIPEPPPPAAAGPSMADFDLPSPAGAPPPEPAGFDFSNLPAPAGAPSDPGGFELDHSRPPEADLPSPAGSAYDFAPTPAAPPPSVNPSASFGEVDFGGGGDSLEFDPTSKSRPDDLEADLSAPLPPPKPAAPADGLEMLSFIDDTAKEAGVKDATHVRRFHIKRRSGKVFGPFEEAVVVKMLEDGQLLGNEEVSLDGESWQPIGAEGAFQAAIAKLMEQPARAGTVPQMPVQSGGGAGVSVPANRPAPPSMERLKQLYEGRMAAVAVVQGKEPVPFSKRVPWIIAGVLLLGIVVAGGWSSTTRYGLFGLKVLFPARVSANTEEGKALAEAKKGLLADTFKGYQNSKELCEKLLRTKPYPEVRAVWMQSVYNLARRYGAVNAADLRTAEAEQENIMLLGEKHVEVVKALANAALNGKDTDKALALVASARARADNEGDLELLFLKAEALATKGQVPQAMTDLKEVLNKDKTSAKALHGLGLLHLKQKEVDLAAGRFGEALAANPQHVSSAVELAAIEVLERKNNAKGTALLDPALAADARVNLAPAELGRALALKAQIAADSKQLDEAVATFEEALKADPANVFAKGAYGALLVERHDYAKAMPMLKDASDKAPQNLGYIETYLNALIGLGKMDEATKVMASASGRFPGNARIAFLSGRVEDGMDRTKQAEESYKRAISADGKMVEANIALSSLYLRLRRFGEAKPQLEEALTKAPDNALVHVGLGELALAENNVDRAQDELNKAADLNPNLPGAFLGLSRVALAKGKPELAEQQALKALKLDPKIHDGRLQYGTALWKLGRLDEAMKELTQAKEDDPRSVNIPITLGAVAFDKGDMDAATANLLGNALQKEPGNADANFYMAKVKRKRAEYTQAIESMKKAIDHAPRRAEFHYELGNIYMDARKGNEAVDEWKAALTIEPKYADALEALGKNALEHNKQREAIDFFQKALDADPGRTRIFASIGDAHSAGGQWPKAIDAYLKALGGEPGFKEVYPKLANAYGEKKKWSDAITWYRKATQADGADLTSWYNLGYALKEKKQYQDAIEALEQFQKLNQDPKMKKQVDDDIYDLKQELR
ncbi:MAG: zinc-ribbon domain-containing protein [Archangiaceae bacterium]|nr:zinc-ribbon domain-containing protein [Archangiaceae bacterium]